MRRKDREVVGLDAILDILGRCDTLRIGMFDADYPYVVPVSFGYETIGGQAVVYFHGAASGKKHALLQANARVCVEADLCHRFVDTGMSVSCIYESVIGFGTARLLSGKEAAHALSCLLRHCGYADYPCEPYAPGALAVYAVALDEITGKHRNP